MTREEFDLRMYGATPARVYPSTDRELAEWDWVVFPNYGRLHHLAESEGHWEQYDQGVTSCGRRGMLAIPGLFTRMGAERCNRCCDKVGYPRGKGSPKNDDACRALVAERLGLRTPKEGRET